jgi:23S rRNA (adenine2030-N6)-methyltransferase
MNYNHHFHIANFADIVKHLILTYYIKYNQQKKSPTLYIDTHSGAGIYDLQHPNALRGGEYINGLFKIYNKLNKICTEYKLLVEKYNENFDKIRFCPGSPFIISHLKRTEDKLIANELHLETFFKLKNSLVNFHNVQVTNLDAFFQITAIFYSENKFSRYVFLIDPSYEKKEEWKLTGELIKKILKHKRNSQIILWFPYKEKQLINTLLGTINVDKMLVTVTDKTAYEAGKMNKCGFILINYSFGIEKLLNKINENIVEWEIEHKIL